MTIPASDELRIALSYDLKLTSAEGLEKVVNDVVRKTFTAKIGGAILEFAHKQPDNAFWSGVKYYGSGNNSRIRIRRTSAKVDQATSTTDSEALQLRRATKPKAVRAPKKAIEPSVG
jgi:hypothetical protein